ncbi:ATP-binding cassette domain-containing protein [Lysobacter sp. S4-A87]|uniref:ABC-F family ATP-binding cassette domain-containing protein n=1 Tax=Lysobacter sp. S4-A87 TaxID=2925843 RepID=UPI001F53A646|nr:ABC-F family ATP-binding cassette domain-containing protein [Lysobacter sp. S4-A87]UNK48753.1 ATP-binding cassette domain-containing protein [Lysobacter sp. S4-A87]
MTTPLLALERVAFVLPDGRPLFTDLDVQLDQRRTGLVGRNGVGKSVLARIVAGDLAPTGGQCLRAGSVHYLPQQIVPAQGASVASVAGVRPVLDALARIENGSVDVADFDLVVDRWDMRERFQAGLIECGLGQLRAHWPAATLSGGELTRVALLGAWLGQADYLVLDEPSNHLDRDQRSALLDQLRRWQRGLLVVSHDRELLESMERIVELTPGGAHDYAGGYSFYAQARARHQAQAERDLARVKLERRRGEAEMREQRERQQRRQSRDARQARDANQAKILLGNLKQWSQASAGKLQHRHADLAAKREEDVREASQRVESEPAVALFAPLPPAAAQRRAVRLEQLLLPFGTAAAHPLDLDIGGCQRIGLVGANGSGKSTLLKVLAGSLAPAGGRCEVNVPAAYLGQQLETLAAQASPLQSLADANPTATQAELRTRLALLGLPGEAALMPNDHLSGGQRLKAALACAVYRVQPAELLLLDEPTNHLDLASVEALEAMLLRYPGAMVVVSHDEAFLQRLALDARLDAGAQGWRLTLM